MTTNIDSNLPTAIKDHLDRIGSIGYNGADHGWTRLAFSMEEGEVHDYARRILNSYGFETSIDSFGNLLGRKTVKPGAPCYLIGTHLDTVSEGGNYDGVVGFITAVEGVRLAETQGLEVNVDIIIFRAEESTRFKKACLGSRAALGSLAQRELDSLHYVTPGKEPITLRQALTNCGFDPSNIDVGHATITPAEYAGYFETHIEQARVLEDSRSLGLVTSIRAPERRAFKFNGIFAIRAAAKFIRSVEAIAETHARLGRDIVATVGRVDNYFEGADKINAVPGSIKISFLNCHEAYSEAIDRVAAARRVSMKKSRTNGHINIAFEGVTDHSGGTPMGKQNRADALVTAAEVVDLLPSSALPSVTSIETYVDIRSNDLETRRKVADEIRRSCRLIAEEFGVDIEIGSQTEATDPVASLDSKMRHALTASASECGIPIIDIASGAGHDAMIVHQGGIRAAMIFTPCRGGLSHNPREHAEISDIALATRLQAAVLNRLK
jgi:hypothetical protein